MTDRAASCALGVYRREVGRIRASGRATEHSYRPALQALIEALGGGGARALNEPAHVACGAPDFIVERGGAPVGTKKLHRLRAARPGRTQATQDRNIVTHVSGL